MNLLSRQTGNSTRRLDVLGTRLLVLGAEELCAVAAEPRAELGEFLLEAGDRLLVHVGLRDDFGHVDCEARRARAYQ